MIEWHLDLVAPWWIVPLYLGGIALVVVVIIGFGALVDRWLGK